jgi:phosphoribosylanthranilate isomerase
MDERVRIKFCGFQRAQDVEEALRLGVDYLGFVFDAGSPRFLDLERAADWLPGLDTGPARRVGVFRDESARRVNEIARRFRLDVIQLRGHEPRDFPRALDLPAFVVRHVSVSLDLPAAAGAEEHLPPNVCAVVVAVEEEASQPGGTGSAASADPWRVPLTCFPGNTPFFLSGGLTAENVAERVAHYQPYGVDVSSGIESAPGRKDAGRMREFMQALGRAP